MSEHSIDIRWQVQGDFTPSEFSREHQIQFQPQVSVVAGGANNDFGADPEQLLAAALASCHMQTFLMLAAKKRLQVESYQDQVVAVVEPREDGKMWVSHIQLTPLAKFVGDKQPDEATVQAMHEKAHQHCFIANSIKSEVTVNPPLLI